MKKRKNKFKDSITIINFSGGLDSSTLLYKALSQGRPVITLGFNYGQKNKPELINRSKILNIYKKEFPNLLNDFVLDIRNIFESTDMIYSELRDSNKIEDETGHKFYTPSRNLLFTVMSTVIGEIAAIAKDFNKVYIGLGIHKHSDAAYSNEKSDSDYWDITPEFAKKLNEVLSLNNVKKIKLFTPFVNKTKSDVVKYMIKKELPYNLFWSCYSPLETMKSNKVIFKPCQKCEACIERELAGQQNNVDDINYYKVTTKIKNK